MFDHILLALDEPKDAALLLPLLRKIAPRATTRVSIVQSAPFLETLLEMPGELSPDPHADDESAESTVRAVVADLRSEGFTADGFTDIGRSGLILASAAERVEASLILLPLRHAGLLKSLVRVSPIAILAVPPSPRRSSPVVLVPIEDERSLEAIPAAAGMARMFQGGLIFVGTDAEPVMVQARARAERELVPTEATLLSDDLPSALLGLSSAMIVLRRSSENLMDRLVEKARVPLLLVPRPPVRPELEAPAPIRLTASPLWSRRRSRNPFEGNNEL